MAKRTIERTALILITGAVLSGFSGCRFGNEVVQATDPSAMSGFYVTEPQSMSVCAFIDGKPTQCAAAATTLIPDVIQNIMTNPVYVSANTKKAQAIVVPNSLDTSSYFDMKLAATGELTAELTTSDPQTLWDDPACTTRLSLEKSGKIATGPASLASGSSGSGSFKTSGSLDFTVAVLTSFGGTCTSSLQAILACYDQVASCPGATAQEQQQEQQSVHDFFAPYLSHGVMTTADIPHLQGFGWQADYR